MHQKLIFEMMQLISGLGRGLVPDQRRPRPPPALHLRQAGLTHLRGSIWLGNSPAPYFAKQHLSRWRGSRRT